MTPYSIYDPATGKILRSGYTHDEAGRDLQQQPGEATFHGPSERNQYVADGALVDMPERPDANHVFDYTLKHWRDPRSLAQVKTAQTGIINTAFEAAAQALTAGYPPTERATWFMQQSEVLAWGADNTKPTPYLDGIAQARGIDPATMRQKTLDNVRLFMAASQFLIGTRQALRDQIAAATNESEVASINWPAP